MPFRLPNAVHETTTTSGTGPLTLLGAVTNRKTFGSQLSNGDTTIIVTTDGTDWEICYGTFTSPSTLSRYAVIYSTNGNALVNWPASGTRDVFVAPPGEVFASLINPNKPAGILAKTADRTYATRSIDVDTDDLQIANPAGTAGNPTLALAFAVSAFAKTLLDDTSEYAMRSTLGVPGLAVANTFTGTQTFSNTTNAAVNVNAGTGGTVSVAGVYLNNNGGQRWALVKNNAAESGSNSGSNLYLYSYDDAGVATTRLSVSRASGSAAWTGAWSVTGLLACTGNATVGGALSVTGAATVGGVLTVSGATSLQGLTATSATLGGNPAAAVYTGSNASNTSYPVGTILAVYTGGTAYDRNASDAIKYMSANTHDFTHAAGAGTTLTGTWRARGTTVSGADMRLLFQRTA